jgi:hypothetical protein
MKGCSGDQSHSWVGMSLHCKKAILILQIVGSTQFSLVTTPLLWWIVNPIFILYGIVWGLVAVFCCLMLLTFLLTSFVPARARSWPHLGHISPFSSGSRTFLADDFLSPSAPASGCIHPCSCCFCHVFIFFAWVLNLFASIGFNLHLVWLRPHWLSVRGSSVPSGNPTRQWNFRPLSRWFSLIFPLKQPIPSGNLT